MMSITDIYSNVNDFSPKAMPIVTKIWREIYLNDDVTPIDLTEIHNATDELYDCFCSGLTDSQKKVLISLEECRYTREAAISEQSGFNAGFCYGFRLALEVLKGGELNG